MKKIQATNGERTRNDMWSTWTKMCARMQSAHTNNYCTLWRLKVISPTSMVTSLGSPVVQYLQIKTTYKIHKSRVEVLSTKAELFSNRTVSDSNKKLITNLSFSGRIMDRFSSLPSVWNFYTSSSSNNFYHGAPCMASNDIFLF